MKRRLLSMLLLFAGLSGSTQPIALHPVNPHYFLYQGKPAVLITSSEHYGAIINGLPDFLQYLDILQRNHFNLTRVFAGSYCESNYYEGDSAKKLTWAEDQNTLSVRPGKLLAPWARSGTPGYVNGGNKFDLDRWDDGYFARLKDFCKAADARGIVVEIVFFSANYGPSNWKNSPLYYRNNINLTQAVPYNEIYSSGYKDLQRYQLAMVRKIVESVNEFDNVYFEICNEPYWLKGIPEVEKTIHEQVVTPAIYAWQKAIAGMVKETEAVLAKKHLIAQNFANTYLKIENPDSAVSVLNFHYAYPPKTIGDNYGLNRPVSFDETFDGTDARGRRREAWAFMLAGGAVYDNLDWSFAQDDMTGTGLNSSGSRHNGTAVWKQLGILHRTLMDFDFIAAKPVDSAFKQGLGTGIELYGLEIPGNDYLLYWIKTSRVSPSSWNCPLPAGKYRIAWMEPASGRIVREKQIQNSGDLLTLVVPAFDDDLALRIKRIK